MIDHVALLYYWFRFKILAGCPHNPLISYSLAQLITESIKSQLANVAHYSTIVYLHIGNLINKLAWYGTGQNTKYKIRQFHRRHWQSFLSLHLVRFYLCFYLRNVFHRPTYSNLFWFNLLRKTHCISNTLSVNGFNSRIRQKFTFIRQQTLKISLVLWRHKDLQNIFLGVLVDSSPPLFLIKIDIPTDGGKYFSQIPPI